ncbi:MAG: TolC family outer membrane protein [Alphaproteobacteria bacterium]|nr:TolC family outer membrane protein [Alphaproteobacteria bacterium]
MSGFPLVFLGAGFCLVTGLGPVASAVHAETLQEALAFAYGANPALQARRAQSRGADEAVPQALAGWRPTVTANGDVREGHYTPPSAFALAPHSTISKGPWRTPHDMNVSMTEALYQGGGTVAGLQRAKSSIQTDRAQLQTVEQSVFLDTATAYMNVLRDMAMVGLNTNNEELLRRQLEAAQNRFQVGEITRTDVSEAESRLAGAKASRIQAEGQLASSQANYERVVGLPPRGLVQPAPIKGLPQSVEEAVSIAREDNPNRVAAVYTSQAADHAVDVARSGLLPTVSVQADSGKAWPPTDNYIRTSQSEILLRGTAPLYEQGATYSQLRAAKHVVGQRRLEAVASERTAVDAARGAWQSLQTARAQIRSFKAQIAANEVALNGVSQESKVGARTVLDVLNAEEELVASRANLIGAERDEMVAEYTLMNTIGQLTVRGLGLPVKPYDPGVHYREVKNQWVGGNDQADRDAAPSANATGGTLPVLASGKSGGRFSGDN